MRLPAYRHTLQFPNICLHYENKVKACAGESLFHKWYINWLHQLQHC